MAIPQNIDKSAFKRGAYVGYADGAWIITKTNSTYGNWLARKQSDPSQTLYAFSLKQMSEKLNAINDGRKQNPGRKRAVNPHSRDMRAAVKLYEDFREKKPRKIKKIPFAIPRVAVDIGYVEFIGYRTTHGRKLTLYKHDFAAGSRPLMCVSPDGRQLLLLGGRYRFTQRGIVDRDAKGREIENAAHGKDI